MPTFGIRHSRWRTWLRGHTPNYRVGFVIPKAQDCGDHEWYNADNQVEHCYHCQAERPRLGGRRDEWRRWPRS
jgi:hypothetical protein